MSPLRFRKVLRDLRASWVRVLLMVVAVGVSVLAVTGFLSARAVIGREIGRNYLATGPASATLVLPSGIDAATLARVRAEPGVLDATVRTTLLARVQVGGRPPQVLMLFVSGTGDSRRIATVDAPPAAWPPAADELLLERTALPFLGVRVGDEVSVLAPGRPAVPFRVAAAAHDGGVAPADQEQTAYGYATTQALARLGVPATLNRLLVVVGTAGRPSGDHASIEAVAQRVAADLAAGGHPVDRIEVPPPLRHPHQGQMQMVGFVLLAFGVIALLLSSLLVATMLGGMLARQIRQIGAMKAVGATTWQVLAPYLLQTLLIALTSTALALEPGLALGRLLARRASALLNLDLASQEAPIWVYAVAGLAGIAVPLLVALIPLLRGSRITVREAIDDQGDGASAAVYRPGLAATAAGLLGGGTARVYALRNLARRRTRLLLSVGLLGTAGAMFLTGLDTAGSWTVLVDQGIAHRHDDLEIRLDRPVEAGLLSAVARSVPGVVGSEAWARTPTAVHRPGRVDIARVYPDDSHASFTVLAPPAGTPLLRLPLQTGRWLRPDDTDAVVLNHLVPAQDAPDIRVGDRITLTVAGHIVSPRVVGIVSDFGTQGTAYLTDREYAAITGTPGQAQVLRVVTARHDRASRQAVLTGLDRALAAAGVPVAQELSVDTLQAALDGHVLVLADALIAIALLTGFVGLLGLGSAMSTAVTERTREFGILHSLGATAGTVRGVVVVEGVATAALSIAAATVVSLPLVAVFGNFLGQQAFRQNLPYRFSPAPLVLWTLLTVAGAAAASAAAAARASRLTIREALTTL